MKGLGIAMIALGGMVIYWAWNGQDLSALPNTPLPSAGPPAAPMGPVTPPPAAGSQLFGQLFPNQSTGAVSNNQGGNLI